MSLDRGELHRRITLLKEKLESGTMHFAPHLIEGFRASFSKVKISADGLVDPGTVDSRIRALCLAIAFQNDRDELKRAIPLRDIQEAYFQRIEYVFGDLYKKMIEHNTTPYQFAGWLSSIEESVTNSSKVIEEFIQETTEFWQSISDTTWTHLEDSFEEKAIFGGEIFPDGDSNITSSTGFYFDTTILPDPFLKISPLLQTMSPREKHFELVRLALQVLSYRNLALADIEKPIIAILPDRHIIEEDYNKFIVDRAEADTLSHAKNLFNIDFSDKEEFLGFLDRFSTAAALVESIRNPSLLVFATEWEGSLESQVNRYLEEEISKLGLTKPGDAVYVQLISRFSQANDIYQRSLQLRGTPVVRAETSWIWFNWMLQRNSLHLQGEALEQFHISRALNTTAKKEFPWLGNIPSESLIEMRKNGALDEIRGVLKDGIKEMLQINPDNFFRTGDRVFDNLSKAFSEHEKRLNELISRKWRFAGRDIGSFIVVGGIEMAAAITGLPLYGVLGGLASMSGVIPTAKEIKERHKKIKEEEKRITNSGIGMLFKNKTR